MTKKGDNKGIGKGNYKHKPGQGFLHRTYKYTVWNGSKIVHIGKLKREAVAAYRRCFRKLKTKTPLPSGTIVRLHRGSRVMRCAFIDQ